MDSISNRQLKLLRKLQRKKYREKEQLFLVEGERAVEQIIDNKVVQIKHLFFDEGQRVWEASPWSEKAGRLPAAVVESGTFWDVTDTDNPQGILALCHMPPETDLERFAEKSGLVVATDRIQDPGNLGTIIRSSVWFNAAGILLGKGTVDLFNPKVVRSTAGSTGSLPFANVSLDKTLSFFEEMGWRILLLDASERAENIRTMSQQEKTVLVIGNEANGIDNTLFSGPSRTVVEIPPSGEKHRVESLNASIALSIALYALTG